MGKIIDKIKANSSSHFFSFEFFPPKTEAGVENLYLRMERMISMQPLFVDVTWAAGTKELTMGICEYVQTYFGVDVMMHLTCTNLTIEELKVILRQAKDAGIQNILALRGEPQMGALSWEPFPGGCKNAIDLVKLIREEHGDYFCIAVGGFPEGHPASKGEDVAQELQYLKEKVEAGANFILTQFFYAPQVFLDFVVNCRGIGIDCPIIPGLMPIQSFSSFKKMTTFCKTLVPDRIWQDLTPIKDNDEEVKAYGVKISVDICNALMHSGVKNFHFYTLNLEKSVMSVLKELSFYGSVASRRFVTMICVFLHRSNFSCVDLNVNS
jgi:methylenetetrahydrofolate reductase (NADPH)